MTELVRYDQMCRAIDAAYEIDEVKDLRDKAAALEHYARQAKNIEAESRCCEIRLRAERKAGELLTRREQPRGNQHGRSDQTTLQDLGITKDQSSNWQKLAAVPKPEFEAALAGPGKPTTNGIIGQPHDGVSDRALWVWGRLKDFAREGILDANPEELIEEMPEHMRETVRTLGPEIVDWLERIIDVL